MATTDASSARSVLIVFDDPDTSSQARQLLEKNGFDVTTVTSGEAALRVIENETLQLVLTDVSLPDVSWSDLLRAMRASCPETPIILTAAKADLDEARNALKRGAFDYIQKPLEADELVAICRQAAEFFQLRVENKILKKATTRALVGISYKPGSSSRPERAAMERAALVRVTRFMGETISKTSTRVLERALGEPASDVALTDVLAEALLNEAAGSEWAAALLRGAQVQRDLLREAGGTLSASEVGDVLGIGRAAVDKRRRQGALLGLRMPSGDFVYPAIQFAKNDVVPGLPDVLGAFRVHDPWMQLDVLMAHDRALDGRTPLEALADGEVERVKMVVSSSGEQGL